MPAAPIPPPFERCEGRCFTFYPAILGVTSNEWTYRGSTWSDIVVRNVANGRDLCIPRRFVGEASEAAENPALVISLCEQLAYREGVVRPFKSRVLEMPPASEDARRAEFTPGTHRAEVVGIRLEPKNASRTGRLMGSAVALGVVGCLALVGYSLQGGESHRRAIIHSLDNTYLTLTSADGYANVVRALGIPDSDRFVITPEGRRLRVLEYADRGFRAVLSPAADGERYVGTVNERGQTLQAVLMPGGETSSFLLRGLEEY